MKKEMVPANEMEPVGNVTVEQANADKKKAKFKNFMVQAATFTFMMMFTIVPGFADATSSLTTIINNMINVVCLIFTAIGVLATVYAVGQLIFAFKNDDPDSKSRASQFLVVGVVLMVFPQIISQLNLTQYITGI